jgi:uncharacterized protein
MWATFAKFVIKYRLPFLVFLLSATAFMGYHGRKAELLYDFVKLVPSDDPEMIYFQNFLKTFGEDGNLMVIGLKDSTAYQVDKFTKLHELSVEFAKTEGVTEVIALSNLKYIHKNEEKKEFDYKLLFPEIPKDQKTLDSLIAFAKTIKLYDGKFGTHKTAQ